MLTEKTHQTRCGIIHYWISDPVSSAKDTLVFLPGLTADHRLFDRQIECFSEQFNVFVWDAPGHAASWPFTFAFDLNDKAAWLHEILKKEFVHRPFLIGQSMGAYVGQAYVQRYPGSLKGFVSIDSAPLQRRFVSGAEIWMLKQTEPIYALYPWPSLLKSGCEGVSTTPYGRSLMHDMMMVYDGDQRRYAALSGHGFRMLAKAMEADLPYRIDCPLMLICGEKDRAGSTKRYNKAWGKALGLKVHWIPGAGHNANTDQPEQVNALILDFVQKAASGK